MLLLPFIPPFYQLAFVLLSVVSSTTSTALVFPKPNGTYGVGLSTMELTDPSRMDPFAPKSQPRKVMVSFFYPTGPIRKCQVQLVDYMPSATASVEDEFFAQYGIPNNTLSRFLLSVCGGHTLDVSEFPLVFFSPGLGDSRFLYNALAQTISSAGYLVVTIDHPYDANVVEFPDGTLALAANISTPAQIDLALQTRVRDVQFVLDSLSFPSTTRHIFPPPLQGAHLQTKRVAITGHSLGGATAAAAMLVDRRFIGGANLDGTFFGPVVRRGLGLPFLIFGHDGKNQSTDASWKTIWPGLRGWKVELMLRGAQHATFTDLPLLADVLGLPGAATKLFLGDLDGGRALKIVAECLVGFLGVVLGDRKTRTLKDVVRQYPEVVVVAGRV